MHTNTKIETFPLVTVCYSFERKRSLLDRYIKSVKFKKSQKQRKNTDNHFAVIFGCTERDIAKTGKMREIFIGNLKS